ncbi:MAG: hypothetical protein RLY31_1760 [Bacteroidota bacterium]|jgi:TM2 domain-containing membrane protein YozV
MKDKYVAGLLALFLGWFGLHRFYLGQVGRGLLYLFFCWFPLVWVISLVDAILLFSMDDRMFHRRYSRVDPPPAAAGGNPHRQNGIARFRNHDYAEAIEDFRRALASDPNDVATHFNIACAYSLTEQAELAFHHLDCAVGLGWNGAQRIREHRALAFLRAQERYPQFERNGFSLSVPSATAGLPAGGADLLAQIGALRKLREEGVLTAEEFERQKRKLLA